MVGHEQRMKPGIVDVTAHLPLSLTQRARAQESFIKEMQPVRKEKNLSDSGDEGKVVMPGCMVTA